MTKGAYLRSQCGLSGPEVVALLAAKSAHNIGMAYKPGWTLARVTENLVVAGLLDRPATGGFCLTEKGFAKYAEVIEARAERMLQRQIKP